MCATISPYMEELMNYELLQDNFGPLLQTKEKSICDFQDFLNETWKGVKPLSKLFKTDSHFYIYDTGTNKIMVSYWKTVIPIQLQILLLNDGWQS